MIIAGGRVYTPDGPQEVDIHVEGERIARLQPWSNPTGPNVVDANGLWVLPGAIDAHVHGRDPGFPEKETFQTLTAAAAAGGVTTVLDMPNTLPGVASREIFEAKRVAVEVKAVVDFGLWALLRSSSTGDEVRDLAAAGATGFKAYLGYAVRRSTGQVLYSPATLDPDLEPPASYGTIARLAPALRAAGRPLAVHAEDPSILLSTMTRIETYADLLESRPDLAEGVAVAAVGELAGRLGLRLHVVHLASRAGLEALRRLRGGFAELSAETCPQYLYLSDADYARLGPVMKMYPLVRGAADREALVEALKAGEIDTVGSDHAPHTDDEKLHQTLAEAHAGSPGVQTLLLSCLQLGGPEQAARWTAENPARIFGLAAKGRLEPGKDADLVLVDPSAKTLVTPEWQRSKQRLAALDGQEFDYAIRSVYLRGAPPAERQGRFLAPTAAASPASDAPDGRALSPRPSPNGV